VTPSLVLTATKHAFWPASLEYPVKVWRQLNGRMTQRPAGRFPRGGGHHRHSGLEQTGGSATLMPVGGAFSRPRTEGARDGKEENDQEGDEEGQQEGGEEKGCQERTEEGLCEENRQEEGRQEEDEDEEGRKEEDRCQEGEEGRCGTRHDLGATASPHEEAFRPVGVLRPPAASDRSDWVSPPLGSGLVGTRHRRLHLSPPFTACRASTATQQLQHHFQQHRIGQSVFMSNINQ
jgi:hypothetical protein